MRLNLPEPSDEPVSCNSWVCKKDKDIFETDNRNLAQKALNAGWEVKTAYQYLRDLNKDHD